MKSRITLERSIGAEVLRQMNLQGVSSEAAAAQLLNGTGRKRLIPALARRCAREAFALKLPDHHEVPIHASRRVTAAVARRKLAGQEDVFTLLEDPSLVELDPSCANVADEDDTRIMHMVWVERSHRRSNWKTLPHLLAQLDWWNYRPGTLEEAVDFIDEHPELMPKGRCLLVLGTHVRGAYERVIRPRETRDIPHSLRWDPQVTYTVTDPGLTRMEPCTYHFAIEREDDGKLHLYATHGDPPHDSCHGLYVLCVLDEARERCELHGQAEIVARTAAQPLPEGRFHVRVDRSRKVTGLDIENLFGGTPAETARMLVDDTRWHKHPSRTGKNDVTAPEVVMARLRFAKGTTLEKMVERGARDGMVLSDRRETLAFWMNRSIREWFADKKVTGYDFALGETYAQTDGGLSYDFSEHWRNAVDIARLYAVDGTTSCALFTRAA